MLNKITPDLETKYDSIKDLIGHNRVKRGWIDGAGTVLKTIFGTLDANDAKVYNDAINKLNREEQMTVKLLADQANVVKTTISNFNSSITNFKENEIIFNKNLLTIQNFVNDRLAMCLLLKSNKT